MDKTILIVDDSEFDRNLLERALTKKGSFKVLKARDGDDCLAQLASQKVDLVLMDILMPGGFGTQVLKTIREKHNQIELPIIMITSKSDAADVVGSLQLGANDYIVKPVNFDIALSRISTHLRLAEVSLEMTKLQQVAILHAMITTYNHEINTPLAIALGSVEKIKNNRADDEAMKKLETACWRIADIVKKIRATTVNEIELVDYASYGKMVKLK